MISDTPVNISERWYSPEGYLYLRQEVADPPSKDYFQLIVTSDKALMSCRGLNMDDAHAEIHALISDNSGRADVLIYTDESVVPEHESVWAFKAYSAGRTVQDASGGFSMATGSRILEALGTPFVTLRYRDWSRLGRFGGRRFFIDFDTDAIQSRLRGELEFLDNLLEGKFNYLDRLNNELQLYIVSFLDVCSTLRLSATSRHFHQLCENNSIWKRHFASSCLPYFITPGLMDIADKKGWKVFYIIVNRIAQSTDEVGTRFLLQKALPTCLGFKSSSQTASSSSSPKVQSKTSL